MILRNHKGFTLIELAIVLIVLALLIYYVGVPLYNKWFTDTDNGSKTEQVEKRSYQINEKTEKKGEPITVKGVLHWIFTNIFYPIIVLGLFACLIIILISIVSSGQTKEGKIRRSVAVSLPIIVTILLMSVNPDSLNLIDQTLKKLTLVYSISIGVISGLAMMELAKYLIVTDSDAAASVYALFISSIVALFLWAFIGDILDGLKIPMLSFIVASGLHIIFRGSP